jgi:16S rRNA U516 pseudouridylate synthase RsuA-like enzyme
MTRIILFNKPFGVLSPVTDAKARLNARPSRRLLMCRMSAPSRLDRDSEGLWC